jgi:hypothetical protein
MSIRPHPWLYAATVAVPFAALMLLTAPAGAKCLDEVRTMAESHDLSSKPPVAMPDPKQATPGMPAVTTGELAKSGGVIAPPTVADRSVIKPPANTDPGMETVPNTGPTPPASSLGAKPDAGTDVGKSAKAGADRTALQAALTAARAAAERGDEQGCEESFAKAKQIAEKP